MASLAINIVIVIITLLIIESVMIKLTAARIEIVPIGEIKNLHKVKKTEIPEATIILADAFKEDPLFKTVLGDAVKNSYKYVLIADFMIRYCHRYGDVYASSERFEGIMAITKDSDTYMTLWRMIRSGSIFPFLKIGLKSFMVAAVALSPIDVTRKKHMKNRSFLYVQIIGVAKDNQGKGFGGKLLTELTGMTDEAGLPIYLETETESNVLFYERFGFKTIQEMHLPGINQPMWAMIREAKVDE